MSVNSLAQRSDQARAGKHVSEAQRKLRNLVFKHIFTYHSQRPDMLRGNLELSHFS